MSEASWIEVNKTWRDFSYPDRHPLCDVGVLVETDDGRQILFGDLNVLGGECDDCRGIWDNTLIVRALDLRSVINRAMAGAK